MTTGSTGVARYVAELDKALVAMGTDLRRYAIGRGPHPAPPDTQRFPVPLRILRHSWRVVPYPRAESLVGEADVVHVTDVVPPPTRLPLVLSVHDLDAVDRPELHNSYARSLQLAQLGAARTRADAVIAVSRTTAAALVAHGVDEERITVVHHGLPRFPTPDAARVPSDPFVLAVGTLDARKGFDILLPAFAAARLGAMPLVIVGPDGHRADEVRALAGEAGLDNRVILAGRVSDAELAALYARASVFCLPSRAEGFGLPVLEAMAAGTPVISSDLPAVREVVGDAAVLVPVGDVPAWTDALERLVADDATRTSLAAKGIAVASQFTWEAAARVTLDVYERVVVGGRRR